MIDCSDGRVIMDLGRDLFRRVMEFIPYHGGVTVQEIADEFDLMYSTVQVAVSGDNNKRYVGWRELGWVDPPRGVRLRPIRVRRRYSVERVMGEYDNLPLYMYRRPWRKEDLRWYVEEYMRRNGPSTNLELYDAVIADNPHRPGNMCLTGRRNFSGFVSRLPSVEVKDVSYVREGLRVHKVVTYALKEGSVNGEE